MYRFHNCDPHTHNTTVASFFTLLENHVLLANLLAKETKKNTGSESSPFDG